MSLSDDLLKLQMPISDDSGGYFVDYALARELAEYARDPAAFKTKQAAALARHRKWYRRLWRWLDTQQYRARWWVSNAVMARGD